MSSRANLVYLNVGSFSSLPINFSGSGDQIILPAVSGQIIRVFRLKLSFQAATTILIKDGANILDGPLFFLANGGMVLDNTGIPWYTAQGNFVINSSNAVQVGGNVDYLQD